MARTCGVKATVAQTLYRLMRMVLSTSIRVEALRVGIVPRRLWPGWIGAGEGEVRGGGKEGVTDGRERMGWAALPARSLVSHSEVWMAVG